MNTAVENDAPKTALSACAESPAPRLRSELIISRQMEGEAAACVVKDPTSGRFFRFRAVEAFILDRLDGTHSLEQIRQRTETEFNAALPAAKIEQFVGRLGALGLLGTDQTRGTAPSLPQQNRRVRGTLFYLRVRLWDPDRFFCRLTKHFNLLFTPAFVMASALMILVAGVVTTANWTEVQLDIPRLASTASLLLAYVVMLSVIALHECAHGLTCKFFGGNVREIGFLLLLFQPAFYCNVSDAWLFPQKARRLWVTFAGAYFEIFIWALSTLVWRITEPWTALNFIALVVMATSGIKSLFNLNPLIKLDGYYLISDWLGVPNLRTRAFGHIGNQLKRLWGADPVPQLAATAREQRIFWIYGVSAWVYTTWLLGLILWYIGGWLVGQYQAWGFAAFVVLLIGILQHPLRNLLRLPLASANARLSARRWLKWTVRAVVLGGMAAALYFWHTELRVAGPFTVLPARNTEVRAAVDGIIGAIYTDEGARLAAGDVIATMRDHEQQAELRKTRAEIEATQARLNLLRAGTRREELQLAQTIAAKAEERIKFARVQLEMEALLFSQNLGSRRDYEEKKEIVAVREKEQQEAEDQLKVLLAGSRREQIEAAEAELRRLNVQQRFLEEQLQQLNIVSPDCGVVITHKLKEKLGQSFRKGDLIATVHEVQTVTVEIAIPESEIGVVNVGQKVVLKTRAFPEKSFEGQVTVIAPIVSESSEPRLPRVVLVTTQLDNRDGMLKPAMTGHAKIYCGERRLLEIVTRRLTRYLKVEFWSWW